jgi:hypothetical protein
VNLLLAYIVDRNDRTAYKFYVKNFFVFENENKISFEIATKKDGVFDDEYERALYEFSALREQFTLKIGGTEGDFWGYYPFEYCVISEVYNNKIIIEFNYNQALNLRNRIEYILNVSSNEEVIYRKDKILDFIDGCEDVDILYKVIDELSLLIKSYEIFFEDKLDGKILYV